MENPNNSPSTNGHYNSMQMPESQMSIHYYLAILYRSRWWIATIFLITVAGVSYFTFTTPPTYQASTTIILDENQGVGQSLFDVTGYSQQRAHINNHVEILKSIFLPTVAMASTLLSSKTDSLQFEELTEENSLL